jgi:hypothetical protein
MTIESNHFENSATSEIFYLRDSDIHPFASALIKPACEKKVMRYLVFGA